MRSLTPEAQEKLRRQVIGAEVSNQRAISGRPHGGPPAGNRLQRRLTGQDQPLKPLRHIVDLG
jgi:hypothetical protein